jgi:c-di-GMP-binding flagellar brake protein YcgR
METLAGGRAHRFLTQIMTKKSNLHLVVTGTEQSIITTIIGLPMVRGRHYVVMAGRDDFTVPLRSLHESSLLCEFLDNSGIRYRFSTRLHKIEGDEIWGCFPDAIIRMQRRQHARVPVPAGSRLRLQQGRQPQFWVMKDISLGGFTIVVPCADKKNWRVRKGDKVDNIRLVLSLKNGWTDIVVRSAVVRRIQEEIRTGDRTCSFQFTSMDDHTLKLLATYILRCERHWIRMARGFDDG